MGTDTRYVLICENGAASHHVTSVIKQADTAGSNHKPYYFTSLFCSKWNKTFLRFNEQQGELKLLLESLPARQRPFQHVLKHMDLGHTF